jgi:glycosyltransferase involved in cell wall biosynthesis
MKILNIGTSFGGGAGIAMRRISEAQESFGINVETWAIKAPFQSDLRRNEKIISRNTVNRARSLAVTKFQSLVIQKSDSLVTSIGIDLLDNQNFYSEINQFDIVNFHSIYNLTKLSTILEVSRIKPTTLTLHDERIFTGGCHYSFSCKGYLSTCGSCPQVHKLFSRIPVRELERNTHDFFSKLNFKNITFISPSTWLAEKAQSKIKSHEVNFEVIPNPIPKLNYEQFQPRYRDPRQLKVGFISENLQNPYKGLNLLIDALNALVDDFEIEFTVAGRGSLSGLDARVHVVRKYLENDLERAVMYGELDFIVVPSLQDNFPSVVSESLMYGTPVIGSDAGGIPEMLMGFDMPTVSARSVENLSCAIREMKKTYDRKSIMEKAHNVFSYEIVGKKYLNLFNSLI